MKPWKIQKFLGDLIYDMRSRGLLPLAGLLLVAMVAVPMYLASQGSEVVPPPATPPADQSALAPENQAAVVAYEPGVRDYRKRIAEQAEKDPFIQQFTVSEKATESLEAATAGSGGNSGTSPVTPIPEPTGGAGTGSTGKVTRFYSFTDVDILVGEAGTELKRMNRILKGTPLPSFEVPLALYMTTTASAGSAVFSISRDVVNVAGGDCNPSPESCQLLALKKGESADLTYAFTNAVYTLKVADIDRRITRKKPKDFGT